MRIADLPPYRGLIFDFNAVLWWDRALQQQAWRTFAAGVRDRPLTAAEIVAHIQGRPNRDALAYLFGRSLMPAEEASYTEQKEAVYRRLCLAPAACVVVEDSPAGLRAARAAGSGYVVALAPPALPEDVVVDAVIPSLEALPRAQLFTAKG